VLESLAGKSLLFTRSPAAFPDQVRFGLYLSIRDYASERLEASGRAGEIGDRHAVYFLAATTAWSAATEGPAGIEPLQRLTLDMENLIAVHHFLLGPSRAERSESRDGALLAALTLESVLTRWGPVATLRSMLEDALGEAATIEPSLRMRGLLARANASYLLGRLDESRADFDAALEIAKKARDRRMKGIIGAGIGAVLREQGRLKEAARWLSDSITQLRACGARRWEVRARTSLGFIYTVTGKGDEARAQHEEAIELLRDEGDREQEAISFMSLGLLSIVEGRLDEAAAHLEEARVRMQQPSPPAFEAAYWRTVAILRQEQGRLDEARASAEASISIARALGNDRLEGFTLFHLGTIHGEMGDLVESRAALERAAALLRRVGDVRAEMLFTAALAAVRARLGDLVASARLFESIAGHLEDPVDAMLGAAIGLYRAELDLEHAARSSEPRAAATAIAAARAAIVAAGSAGGGQPLIPGSAAARSQHVRVALRMLERLLTERQEAGVPSAREKVLVVAPDARWCRLPDGTEVAFKRGRAQRLMLLRLFEERLRAPGRALPIADLFASGWPGERASADALENRVYVGISRLRKLGFRDLIQSRDDGFLLDPDVPSYRADKPF
jgi:tetratricopeptide (TPR) repeat protein